MVGYCRHRLTELILIAERARQLSKIERWSVPSGILGTTLPHLSLKVKWLRLGLGKGSG